VQSPQKSRDVEFPADILTDDLESIVTDPTIDIVAELMGGLKPARTLILKAIANGKHVVTANKAVVARYGEEIFAAADRAGVYVLLEAAVGGGIPIIQPLKQCLGGNRLVGITGIVNGTTNFILTQMTGAGKTFDDALAIAQERGYAEADPTADVDGWDAADKIAILASLAFGERVEREEVYCEGIRHITAADIRYASEWGFAVKLLAYARRPSVSEGGIDIRVHPTLLPGSHPLAGVNQVDNAVLVEGEPIGQVMFFGPGAGRGPTASAVVSDILNIVTLLEAGAAHPNQLFRFDCPHVARTQEIASVRQRFYARVIAKDMPGVIGAIGTCFGSHNVSLELVVQKDWYGDKAEIVVLTHNVAERNFQQALEEIRRLPAIDSVPTFLRVLPD
jgi:homoserine dehydrogenase